MALIRSRELRRRYGGISHVTQWRWEKKGLIPKPDRIIEGHKFYDERKHPRRVVDEAEAEE